MQNICGLTSTVNTANLTTARVYDDPFIEQVCEATVM